MRFNPSPLPFRLISTSPARDPLPPTATCHGRWKLEIMAPGSGRDFNCSWEHCGKVRFVLQFFFALDSEDSGLRSK